MVDRLLLIEVLRRLEKSADLSKYTYYGFGGPYLEEFRLLYEICPQIGMVSIEEDNETYKRQKFHLPCGSLTLLKTRLESFLAQYDPGDEKSVFWLDYTGLEYGDFENFMLLLNKVAANSIVKVTLRAEPRDYFNKEKEFRAKFELVMPDPLEDPPSLSRDFATLVQNMLRVAAQRALPSGIPHTYQPISSFYYSDGTWMVTVTGIVCLRTDAAAFRKLYQTWPYANLQWRTPKKIDVPTLTTKERLHLAKHLPCAGAAGKKLVKTLGYLIDEDRSRSEAKMKQYADFHRYFPYFVRAAP
jgi:hypothetical protein